MWYCLDLQPDSSLAKFLSQKFVAVLVAVIQLIIWAAAILAIIAPPASVKAQLHTAPAGAIPFTVIFILAAIGFSVLLLVGILKDNRLFIQVFLVFEMVVIVLFVIGILFNIFTQPSRFGLSRFLSGIFLILLDILTYFIIRNYYLGLNGTDTGLAQNQNTKGIGV